MHSQNWKQLKPLCFFRYSISLPFLHSCQQPHFPSVTSSMIYTHLLLKSPRRLMKLINLNFIPYFECFGAIEALCIIIGVTVKKIKTEFWKFSVVLFPPFHVVQDIDPSAKFSTVGLRSKTQLYSLSWFCKKKSL